MSRRHIIVAAAACGLLAIAAPAFAAMQAAADVPITDWIRTFWPIVLVASGLITTGVLLGLGTRFASTSSVTALRARVDKIDTDCAARDIRMTAIETNLKDSPTRQELAEDIAELGERLKGVEVGMEGIGGQLTTTNTYLQMLLERGLKGAA